MWTALLRFPREATTAQAEDEMGRASEKAFLIDVLTCRCGEKRSPIAAITAPGVIVKILDHLGLPSEPPQVTPARAPPHRGDHGMTEG